MLKFNRFEDDQETNVIRHGINELTGRKQKCVQFLYN